jgi:WxcM-like, C-terminal
VTRHRLINLPVRPDYRGNLTFVEGGRHIPFDIRRVFYLYDVPGGQSRAGHALKDIEQVLVAVSGSFDVILDYGEECSKITLNRPYVGLYLPSLVWRELENFSSGSVCLVFASDRYSEAAYYRSYEQFKAALPDVRE